MRSFEQQNASVHEILYYHKNSTGIWLEVILMTMILIVMMMMIIKSPIITRTPPRSGSKWSSPCWWWRLSWSRSSSFALITRLRWFQSEMRLSWWYSSSATTGTSLPSRLEKAPCIWADIWILSSCISHLHQSYFLLLCNYRDITAFKVRQGTLYLSRYLDLDQLYFSSTPIIFPAYLIHVMKISLASMLVSKTQGSDSRRLQKLWQPWRW